MRFTADELTEATAGRRRGPSAVVDGATVDSRDVVPGQLFVPVVGARDGPDYVGAAIAAGAAAHLTSRARAEGDRGPSSADTTTGPTAIEVGDTVAALAALGRLARSRLPERAVGITGSVGKTTVKDLAAAVLGTTLRTSAAVRSFNNELGVPLTLMNAPEGTEAVVLELGARGLGHVAYLCAIARPTVGVVTTVGAAHLELFGSIEQVARSKGELVEALPATGTAVLNADDALVASMAGRTAAAVLRYGLGGRVGDGLSASSNAAGTASTSASANARVDIVAEDVALDAELRPRFTLWSPWGRAEVALEVRGRHMVPNALAAAAVGFALGLGPEAVAAGLAAARPSPWRMEVGRARSGLIVVNDAYNANPVSMRAALESLAALPARRRVAVLGRMAELGPSAAAAHTSVAELAGSLGIDVVAVACDLYGQPPAPDAAGALDHLLGLGLGPGDAVLVKGSRVAGLEGLAAQLGRR